MADSGHQKVEAALIAYALSLPETDLVRGLGVTRYLHVRGKGFAIFGEKNEPADALTLIVKLPASAPLAADLPFVREARGWWKQHDWVTAHFGPDDDARAEIETLRYWIRQSYAAVAPKRLGRMVEAAAQSDGPF
ncbi:MAG: MmcQ/YjbR family DNA-binding protein [Parvularculaceae bacterium]|nr:MmcQ/YjbR family DNA-binding protein [Parvularculaceae bacterium]